MHAKELFKNTLSILIDRVLECC